MMAMMRDDEDDGDDSDDDDDSDDYLGVCAPYPTAVAVPPAAR